MRGRLAIIAGVVVAAAVLAGFGVAAPNRPETLAQRGETGTVAVDVEVVLAVDVSYSMDPEEQALQREGYMAALTSREFLQALKQGAHGRIALTYFEWAGTQPSADHRAVAADRRPGGGRRLCRRHRAGALYAGDRGPRSRAR